MKLPSILKVVVSRGYSLRLKSLVEYKNNHEDTSVSRTKIDQSLSNSIGEKEMDKNPEIIETGVIYVICTNHSKDKVIEVAKNSKMSIEAYKTDHDSIDVVINLKGTKMEIKNLSKNISTISGVDSVQYIIT
jgi:metal-responsive CopG/Arc/MetJ family transcriptional regulator